MNKISEALARKNKIRLHYENIWKTEGEEIFFKKGPVKELPAGFSVFEFPAHGNREMWTYATCCMSQECDEISLELHIFLRGEK